MEFFKPGLSFDVMKYRNYFIVASIVAIIATALLLFVPGPNYGIDFVGGTELQLQFKKNISPQEVRKALEDTGHHGADVVAVSGRPREYIIRVQEVSTLPAGRQREIEIRLREKLQGVSLSEKIKVSPAGDKLTLRLSGEMEAEALQAALTESGAEVIEVRPFGRETDYRYEARLRGAADKIVADLTEKLGDRAPNDPLRIEWVGPKAGAQLRDAAIKSLLFAIAFIMIYVAFRFDLRFAPGGVLALLHDVFFTVGFLILVRSEFTLTTIAALLTVLGYSINDTIVVYDRIRENMSRMRDTSLHELINLSTSQTLSRTIITSATTMVSIAPFFIFGTPVIRDFALALFVGILVGTYSSIYIAAPVTEWMDKRFFQK